MKAIWIFVFTIVIFGNNVASTIEYYVPKCECSCISQKCRGQIHPAATCKWGFTPCCYGFTDHFLENDDNEIRSHSAILEHNLKAIRDYEGQVVDNTNYNSDFTSCQVNYFCKLANNLKENNQIEKDCQLLDAELCFLLDQIYLKENTIHDLTQQLQQKKETFEKLKLEQETTSRNNQNKLNALQSALNHFTNNFQYIINMEDSVVEADKYCVTLSFIINKVVSQYPIRFIFDRNSDKLLDFDAKELLTEDEHNILTDLYSKKRNNLALLCRLRNITKKRMCEVENGPEVNGCM